MRPLVLAISLMLFSVLAGCFGGGEETKDTAHGVDTNPFAKDTADGGALDVPLADGMELPDGVVLPDAGAGCLSAGCPIGVCDPYTATCVPCLDDSHCETWEFCFDEQCLPDVCDQGDRTCVDGKVVVCADNGASYDISECPEGEACFAGGCEPTICEPWSLSCKDFFIQHCDGTGTATHLYPCPPGYACIGDLPCQEYKHNVIVVFDTSGSMSWGEGCLDGSASCEKPWPECEQANNPYSTLGYCKMTFNKFFSQGADYNVNFMLFHFPQEESAGYESCSSGYYDSMDKIDGDNGVHVTPDGPSSWFEQNMHQVLSVGIPETIEDDTLEEVKAWTDFVESWQSLGATCSGDSSCPGGFCLNGACTVHTNPELRATGGTPIGKTMFYAGEYVRKFVVVDGKSCETDADCGNPNYLCSDETKTCFDPLGKCRQNIMIVFTDGDETNNTSLSDFFNPVVQSKRFNMGLGCSTDDDCMSGAICDTFSSTCQPEDGTIDSGDEVTLDDGYEGADFLRDYNGDPIHMTVNFIDTEGSDDNELASKYGGGIHYTVNVTDISTFLAILETLIDVKVDSHGCIPEIPGQVPVDEPDTPDTSPESVYEIQPEVVSETVPGI